MDVGAGGPADDKKDVREHGDKVWTGVVPTWVQYGPLLQGRENRVEGVPEYLKWVEFPFFCSGNMLTDVL